MNNHERTTQKHGVVLGEPKGKPRTTQTVIEPRKNHAELRWRPPCPAWVMDEGRLSGGPSIHTTRTTDDSSRHAEFHARVDQIGKGS